jgi:cytochrome c
MTRRLALAASVAIPALAASSYAADDASSGDPQQGAQAFRACAACHSLQPDKNLTGPSLADLWGRKAGSLPSFQRYSPALRSSSIVWNGDTLDAWLKDPRRDVPGNRMTFPGIKDDQTRHDLLAFLKEATKPGAEPQTHATQPGAGMMGGMGGMMGGGQQVPDLKKLDADDRVTCITYCRDTYRVTTAAGETHEIWERNLRFKTDSTEDGPAKGAPALVGAGMMGDRADVIFSSPEEISATIKPQC